MTIYLISAEIIDQSSSGKKLDGNDIDEALNLKYEGAGNAIHRIAKNMWLYNDRQNVTNLQSLIVVATGTDVDNRVFVCKLANSGVGWQNLLDGSEEWMRGNNLI